MLSRGWSTLLLLEFYKNGLLLMLCLMFLSLFVGFLCVPCFVMQYLVSFLDLQQSC